MGRVTLNGSMWSLDLLEEQKHTYSCSSNLPVCLFSLYKWEHWDPKRLSNMLMVIGHREPLQILEQSGDSDKNSIPDRLVWQSDTWGAAEGKQRKLAERSKQLFPWFPLKDTSLSNGYFWGVSQTRLLSIEAWSLEGKCYQESQNCLPLSGSEPSA